MPARLGHRFLITKAHFRLATSRLIRKILQPFGLAQARTTANAALVMAMAFIDLKMADKSWRNMGLKTSEHIGRIAIDPRDSNVVYVAAQGPLWSGGGERGLYKTTDGGKTWKALLPISENTGVTDVVIDPSNPDTMYAATWQRRRHFYTLINGGPESAIHKSTDGGATWTKLRSGLPPGDLGRIGLSISPANTNVVYATVEAGGNLSGIFRSNDRGATWERTSSNISQGMYYGQIVADPKNVDRIYIPNVVFQVSDDARKNATSARRTTQAR